MLDFLITVLTLALSLGTSGHPDFDSLTITNRIADIVSEVTNAPQGDLVNPNPPGLNTAINGPELPTQTQSANQEPQNTFDLQNHQENAVHPNTKPIETYNQESEKYVGYVASVAVEQAEPLIPCSDDPTLCTTNPEPLPDPVPDPLPTPPDPSPTTITLPVIEPCPPQPDLPRGSQGFHPAAPQLICPD